MEGVEYDLNYSVSRWSGKKMNNVADTVHGSMLNSVRGLLHHLSFIVSLPSNYGHSHAFGFSLSQNINMVFVIMITQRYSVSEVKCIIRGDVGKYGAMPT